jgi:hypothetical protein
MSLKNFTMYNDSGIYERGEDTCQHPFAVISERPDGKWNVAVCVPTLRQLLPMSERFSHHVANTYRKAVALANSFKF